MLNFQGIGVMGSLGTEMEGMVNQVENWTPP